MSFSTRAADKFATVYDRSPYSVLDPLVKLQHAPSNNIVFGRKVEQDVFGSLIYIGKVYENTVGRNYLSCDAWLDVTFPHVVYVTGARGSGKSFDLGVIVEGISALTKPSPVQNSVEPLCSIVIDTQSQFWTLKYPPNPKVPENRRQIEELAKWNIKTNSLAECRLFIPPHSQPTTGDETTFQLRTSHIRHEDWCALIGEPVYGPQGHVLGRAIEELAAQTYSLEDLIKYLEAGIAWGGVPDSARNALIYKLHGYRRTGLFGRDGIQIRDLLKPGQCSVFMLRDIRNEDKALVTAVIARQLSTVMGEFHRKLKVEKFFSANGKRSSLPAKVWLLIDEAHVVAPSGGTSPATEPLIDYVKRGRDSGLSLVMATQQPSAVDDRILSQVNVTFSHRLAFQADISAALNRIPTKMVSCLKYSGREISDFGDMLRYLEAGECFIGDHNTSRAVLASIRPRITSHGGYSPS